MKLIRTLHPVGHGAFFTEQIVDDSGNVVFTAVYDCGSTQKKSLTAYIPQAIDCDEHIDLLCISHFDDDHINGLTTLISHATIDNRTIVMVPFAFPKALVVFNHPISAIVSLLLTHGAHLVGVEMEETPTTVEFDALFSRPSISSGTKVVLSMANAHWLYVPYMHYNGYTDALKHFEDCLKDNLEKTMLSHLDLRDGGTRRQLKSIYKRLKPLDSTRVTAINMNSLMLLSAPAHEYTCSWLIEAGCGVDSLCGHDDLHMMPSMDIAPSCFYTGDTDLHEIAVYNRLMNHVTAGNNLKVLGLLQIPHHGSANNYGTHIVQDRRYEVAFVNYNTQHMAFPHLVVTDFHNAMRPLLHVTEHRSSLTKHTIVI